MDDFSLEIWYNYYDRKEYNLKTKSKFILAKMLKKGQTSPYPKLKSKFNYLIWRSD